MNLLISYVLSIGGSSKGKKKGKYMEIVNKRIEDLRAYTNNPRINDEAVKYVANSIKEFGFKVPVIIDKNNVIVAGHTRILACKELGIKEVPCIIADDLTDEQIKAFRLADNKVSEIAVWDLDKLDEELDGIFDLDMSKFGFLNIELDEPTDLEADDEKKGNVIVTLNVPTVADWNLVQDEIKRIASEIEASVSVKMQ